MLTIAINRYSMVRVSNIKLQEKTLRKLQTRFADSIASVTKPQDASLFLQELLGPEEQLMLAKRLATIYMLAEGVSGYRIGQVLGLSTSTVNHMRDMFHKEAYVTIVKNYTHVQNHSDFWDDIEVLLRLGMPPMGKGRWKWLHELENKKR